jgi:hypothetical protein
MAAGDITLLYSSRGTEHNNGVALREYLTTRLQKVAPRQRALTSGGWVCASGRSGRAMCRAVRIACSVVGLDW